jgi:chromate reductase
MRILGVSGSLRQGSFNTALLRAASELAPPGMQIEPYDLHGLALFDQDVEAAGDPPEVEAWKQAIESVDGLLLACPEYNGGITGVLKNAVDWASRAGSARERAPLLGKRVCIVGASPGVTGTVRAQDQLRQVLRRAGARVEPMGDLLVGLAHTKIIEGQLRDQHTRDQLARHLKSYADILDG